MAINEFVDMWLIKLSLYKKVGLSEEDSQNIARNIQSLQGSFDQYCPLCQQDATFRLQVDPDFTQAQKRFQAALTLSNVGRGGTPKHTFLDFSKTAVCTRGGHRQIYHYQAHEDGIVKIGQFPSMADISIGDLARYQKALGAQDVKALKTAIRLNAHGVGAGSFVYLRRIFEGQVGMAHDQAKSNPSWDEDAFRSMRMGEKIQALKHHLPEVLVNNSSLYGILSEHIHSLSEVDCLENFDLVLQGILLIAEERLIELERAQRLSKFQKSKDELLSARAAKTEK